MCKVRFCAHPLGEEPQQVVFTPLELSPAQPSPERLVDEPDAIGADNIGLTISRHLSDPTLPHIPLHLTTVDVRLAGKPERSAQVVEAGFGSLVEGRERIAKPATLAVTKPQKRS